jgi:release factor glutamine methyltransferase
VPGHEFAAPGISGIPSLLSAAESYLADHGVADARRHAEWLLGHLMNLPRHEFYLHPERTIMADSLAEFERRVSRRAQGEPTQYINGEVEFYGLNIACDRRALIPRPETELLVEQLVQLARSLPRRPVTLLDLGTGTGCIAVCAARHVDDLQVVATDLLPGPLGLARENAARHGVADRIEFRQSDLFSQVPEWFDLLAANLPYVAMGDRHLLEREVRDWEPPEALFAGADGLEFLEPAIREAANHLEPAGYLLLEIGAGQLAAVKGLLEATGRFESIEYRPDYQGHARVVQARRI